MVIVHAFVEVKEGTVSEFVKSAERLIEATRKEKGNNFYTFYQDAQAPTKFVVVEEWDSKEVLDLHMTLPHLKEHVEEVKDMIVAPAVMKVYEAKEL